MNYVYETTNLVNGRKYIGKHRGKADDSYLGSGTLLFRAIKKHGKENFERKILKEFDSEDDAYKYEQKLVTKEIVESNEYYNIAYGGEGWNSGNSKKLWEDPEHRKNISRKTKKQWEDPKFRESMTGENNPFFGKHHTEENRNIMKNKNKDRWKDPIHRIKMEKIMRTPEDRKRRSGNAKRQWEDPKFREKMTKRIEGEKHYNARLTEKQVIEIKERLQKGERNINIAKDYDVTNHHISAIKTGKKWKHITI